MSRPVPLGLAMLLCDYVIEDKQSNKKSLIGLFSNISAKKFPASHYKMNVFVVLSDGHGKYQGELRCISADDDKVVSTMRGPVEFPDPQAVLEFNFEMFGLTFPDPGKYIMQFLCDDVIVIQRKMTVTDIKKPSDAEALEGEEEEGEMEEEE